MVLLAAFTSLRWRELAALRRSDIDAKARTVQVTRQLNERDGGGFLFGLPKSEASTAAPVGIMTACPGLGKTLADLRFEVSAPTATRTRDLLLRRQSLYPLSYRGLPTA